MARFLSETLKNIEKMPENSFDEIADKLPIPLWRGMAEAHAYGLT